MPIFDTHAHYDSGGFNADRDAVLSALPAAFPGALTGMYFFHHKTRHRKFVYGVPAIGIVEILLALGLIVG